MPPALGMRKRLFLVVVLKVGKGLLTALVEEENPVELRELDERLQPLRQTDEDRRAARRLHLAMGEKERAEAGAVAEHYLVKIDEEDFDAGPCMHKELRLEI